MVIASDCMLVMRVINPEGMYDATERLYSHARVENGTLYMSGQVGRDRHGEVVGSDIESQTRRAFENVETILDAVDEDRTAIAKVTSYFTDIESDFTAYKRVWGEIFDEPYPAHTAIGVEALATPELRLELEVEVPLEE
jgi:2-iminobutanoate/2-iminopropanoate deaminase